jgi:hypothetical protein
MPLHTAASAAVSVPSAEDIVVSAGLAQRASDGSLLNSAAPSPEGVTIQRQPEEGVSSFTVQRDTAPAGTSASASAAPAPPADAGPPDAKEDSIRHTREAKEMYQYIRAQLEADLRRQLEGRSWSGRFRP